MNFMTQILKVQEKMKGEFNCILGYAHVQFGRCQLFGKSITLYIQGATKYADCMEHFSMRGTWSLKAEITHRGTGHKHLGGGTWRKFICRRSTRFLISTSRWDNSLATTRLRVGQAGFYSRLGRTDAHIGFGAHPGTYLTGTWASILGG
jgi:hypothetical protein